MNELIYTGMKRRKKEIRYVVLVTLITTFFMSGILMFQNILNAYILEKNRDSYGDWIFSSDKGDLAHGYLCDKGSLSTSIFTCNEDGRGALFRLGSISDELLSFSRIGLYEGRFPESGNEIVTDLRTLQKMGLSYEIGQEITIYWDASERGEDKDIRSKTYTLTGTMKPFNQQWYQGQYVQYPDLVVTKEELETFGKEPKTTWFYRMDPTLTKVDTDLFYKEFDEAIQNSENTDPKNQPKLNYNGYVYKHTLWGNSGVGLVSVMMICLSVFAVSFVLSSYTDGRRAAYYRLRTLGCSRAKLNGIIFRECGLAAFPAAVLGLALAYLFGWLGCLLIAKSVSLYGFFAFDLTVFLLQLAAVFGSILLAIFLTILRMRDGRLSAETRALSPRDLKKLRKALPKLKTPEQEFFKRRRILTRRSLLLTAVFTLIVASFLVMCGVSIYRAIDNYHETQKEPDYILSFENPGMLQFSYSFYADDGTLLTQANGEPLVSNEFLSGHNPYYGPSDEDLEYLRSITGIREFRGRIRDEWHLVTWDGIDDWKGIGRDYYATEDGTLYRNRVTKIQAFIVIVPDEAFLRELAEDYGVPLTKEQLRTVMNGEAVFMLYNAENTNYFGYQGPWDMMPEEEPVDDTDTMTLKEGDLIHVMSATSGNELAIPVIPVPRKDLFLFKYYYTVTMGLDITLFVSESVAEQLRQLEDPVPEFRENHFNLWFNSFSSFEATDKILASYMSNVQRGEYYNNAERKRINIQSYTVRPLIVYGSLFLMTFFVYLIISRNLIEARTYRSAESYERIRRIGMTKRNWRLLLLKSELVENLPVLAGFFTGLLYPFFSTYIHWMKETNAMTDSIILKEMTSNPLLISFEQVVFRSGILYIALMILLIYVLMVFFGYRTSLNILEREERI